MKINFEKWHGCSNDFVIVWFIHDDQVEQSLIQRSPELCRRDGQGIGADGVILMHLENSLDSMPQKISIINSDGSIAATCGNGIRCAASSIRQRIEESSDMDVPEALEITLRNEAKVLCRFLKQNGMVSVDMGIMSPILKEPWTTFTAQKLSSYENLLGRDPSFGIYEILNQHILITPQDHNQEAIRVVGPELQESPHWDGINVHIAFEKSLESQDNDRAYREIGAPIEELWQAHVWERGAGPTKACGSGACAIATHIFQGGMVEKNSWVGIDMEGGRLYVQHRDPKDPTLLSGPSQIVFRGHLNF